MWKLNSITFALSIGVLIGSPIAFAKNKPAQKCMVYFMVIEHDEQTSNLQMTGLNEPQQSWYKKHGTQKFPGICLVNSNAAGTRVTVENADEKYTTSIVGTAPLYAVTWEEHLVFIPDSYGGHNAYNATGVLYIWNLSTNGGKGDFVPISPVRDTNRTIFSSSSTSLLKNALKQIQERSTQGPSAR